MKAADKDHFSCRRTMVSDISIEASLWEVHALWYGTYFTRAFEKGSCGMLCFLNGLFT